MKTFKNLIIASMFSLILISMLTVFNKKLSYRNNIQFLINNTTIHNSLTASNFMQTDSIAKDEHLNTIKYMPILMYHNITTNPLKTNKITVTQKRFARDMNFIKKNGYTSISYMDLKLFKEGKFNLPSKPIIITFDDGKKNVYDLAYPILKKHKFKFTFFVIGKRLEQLSEDKKFGEYITWGQAKEMYDSGLAEIQPHTYDMHYAKESLTRGVGVLPFTGEIEHNHYNRFKDDTEKIVKAIKDKVGSESYVYSYPYGKHNHTNEKVLSDMGFSISTVTNTHYTDISGSLWNLKRINVPCQIELEDLLQRVQFIK